MSMRGLSTHRLLTLAAAFVLTAALVETAASQRYVPPRPPLRGFPIQVGGWRGHVTPDFDARVVRVLGADEYLTRIYRQDAEPPIDFFVGFYGNQTSGSLIHSPLNCLPGAGWQILTRDEIELQVPSAPGGNAPARAIVVNQVVMQKGDERLLALYWYQERGRVIASEYVSRVYMMLDAARRGRTDGALVRVVTPIEPDAPAGAAARRLVSFVQSMFPILDTYVPA